MVWLIVTGLLGNAQKAGLFATLGLVVFYTSGRLPQFVDSWLSQLSWYWVHTQVKTSSAPRLSHGLCDLRGGRALSDIKAEAH